MAKVVTFGLIVCFIFNSYCIFADSPVTIGLSTGLTGKYQPMALMQKRALLMWESEVNAKGGILSRPVKLSIYDDQSKKEVSIAIYRRMIELEKMDFLIAPYSSGITAAILPITEKHHYPVLTPGAAADSLWDNNYRYVFGVYVPASRYSLGFLEMMLTHGVNKVAVISMDNTFSRSVAKGAKTWTKRFGMELAINMELKVKSPDFKLAARQAKAQGVEAILMCGHFTEAVAMRQALKAINWYPKAYFASVGPVLDNYYKQLKKDAEFTFSSTQWQYHPQLPFPGAKQFYQTFVKRYQQEPSYHAAAAYASGYILKKAIERANSFDREKVREQLSKMDLMTLIGRYGVDSTGIQLRQFPLVIQWVKGKKEVVWPSELNTVEARFP